jgi:hypothetical protein
MRRPAQIQQGATQQRQAPKPSQAGGMLGGAMGSMMSDKNSKEEIQRLESANDALTQALSSKASYPDTHAASPGMQALGQQDAPGQSDIRDPWADRDTPAANKVAAQNVGMAATTPNGPSAGFQVNQGMPDMSALDEAYRRIGATSGG